MEIMIPHWLLLILGVFLILLGIAMTVAAAKGTIAMVGLGGGLPGAYIPGCAIVLFVCIPVVALGCWLLYLTL